MFQVDNKIQAPVIVCSYPSRRFAFPSLATVNIKYNFKEVRVIVLWHSKDSQTNQTEKQNNIDFVARFMWICRAERA